MTNINENTIFSKFAEVAILNQDGGPGSLTKSHKRKNATAIVFTRFLAKIEIYKTLDGRHFRTGQDIQKIIRMKVVEIVTAIPKHFELSSCD